MELKRVVVTGLGAITPLGKSVDETWTNMVKGVSGAAAITRFDASKFKTQFACEIKDFNVKIYACEACSHYYGLKREDLIDNAEIKSGTFLAELILEREGLTF